MIYEVKKMGKTTLLNYKYRFTDNGRLHYPVKSEFVKGGLLISDYPVCILLTEKGQKILYNILKKKFKPR